MTKVFIKSNHRQKGLGRFLESLQIDEKIEIVDIERLADISKHECDIAIFGGFLPQEIINFPFKKKYYTFCSPFGQADLSSADFYSTEISILHALQWYIQTKQITNGITQSKSLASRFGYIYIPPVKIIKDSDVHYETSRKNYGLVGNNYRKHRNVVNQIAAISALEPREAIVVSDAINYKHFNNLFDCKFISPSMQTDEEYYKEIASHRLSFQCSWSEAFSYITLEYCMMGVPTICSPCIDWYPELACIVDNVDNWSNITAAANFLLKDKDKYWALSDYLSEWAKEFNRQNIDQLRETIYENLTICA
jgi:hypothetical protein